MNSYSLHIEPSPPSYVWITSHCPEVIIFLAELGKKFHRNSICEEFGFVTNDSKTTKWCTTTLTVVSMFDINL